jgi:hypothetical protein
MGSNHNVYLKKYCGVCLMKNGFFLKFNLILLIVILLAPIGFAQSEGPNIINVRNNGDGTVSVVFDKDVKASGSFDVDRVSMTDSSGNSVPVKGIVAGGKIANELTIKIGGTTSSNYKVNLPKDFVKDKNGNSNAETSGSWNIDIDNALKTVIEDSPMASVMAEEGVDFNTFSTMPESQTEPDETESTSDASTDSSSTTSQSTTTQPRSSGYSSSSSSGSSHSSSSGSSPRDILRGHKV